MDKRPVGVFDSGLGGLTAVRAMTELFPHEDIIYFGDNGRVPYGTRSRSTILRYAGQGVALLASLDVKSIVVACGTVSAVALDELECDRPMTGVIHPSVERAAKLTKNGKVGLIATPASVRSGAYSRAMSAVSPDVELISRDCRLLVPLVEAGRFAPDDRVAQILVAEYLSPLREAGVDTLILGCTHYPLLAPLIADFMGSGVELVNSGEEAVRALDGMMEPGDTSRLGSCSFYVSDDPEGFVSSASIFLQSDVRGEVTLVDIDRMA